SSDQPRSARRLRSRWASWRSILNMSGAASIKEIISQIWNIHNSWFGGFAWRRQGHSAPHAALSCKSAVVARRCTPALAARIVAAGVGRREIAFFGDAPRTRALVGSGSAAVEHRLVAALRARRVIHIGARRIVVGHASWPRRTAIRIRLG